MLVVCRYRAPVPQRVRNWLMPLAWVAAVTAVLLLLFPYGFPNYDTIYALVWGRELAHGMSPDMGAALPPTPHPLGELFGLVDDPARRTARSTLTMASPTPRWGWSATSSTGSDRSGSTGRSARSRR